MPSSEREKYNKALKTQKHLRTHSVDKVERYYDGQIVTTKNGERWKMPITANYGLSVVRAGSCANIPTDH